MDKINQNKYLNMIRTFLSFLVALIVTPFVVSYYFLSFYTNKFIGWIKFGDYSSTDPKDYV